jgi:uncharacterized protein YcfJ
MTSNRLRLSSLAAVLLLSACATTPTGPEILALPGSGKSLEQFRSDDVVCRQYAVDQLGGKTPSQAANDSALRSAVVGTAVGAVAGAAIGGHEGAGAGVGAGTGLVVGSVAGSGAADSSWTSAQKRYDFAYVQCMYAQGHRIPVLGRSY